MKEQTGIIYEAYCLPTGLSYIGQTTNLAKRMTKHLNRASGGSDTYFHNAIRKYGADAFVWSFLVNGIPLSQLNTQEVFWIRFRNTYLGPGYNMTAGGEANPMENPESVEKMRASNRETQRQMVDDGTHNFVMDNPGPESNQQRMDDGTHNFLIDHPSPKRIEEGTHNFQLDNPMEDLSIVERASHGAKVSAGRHASKQEGYREERIAAIKAGQMFFTEEEE